MLMQMCPNCCVTWCGMVRLVCSVAGSCLCAVQRWGLVCFASVTMPSFLALLGWHTVSPGSLLDAGRVLAVTKRWCQLLHSYAHLLLVLHGAGSSVALVTSPSTLTFLLQNATQCSSAYVGQVLPGCLPLKRHCSCLLLQYSALCCMYALL